MDRKNKIRILSIILAIVMIVSLVSNINLMEVRATNEGTQGLEHESITEVNEDEIPASTTEEGGDDEQNNPNDGDAGDNEDGTDETGHSHRWTYSIGDSVNKITAICSGEGECEVTTALTLIITVQDREASGSAYTGLTIEGIES